MAIKNIKVKYITPFGVEFVQSQALTAKISPHFQMYEIANQKCDKDIKLLITADSNYNTWTALKCLELIRDKHYNGYGKGLVISAMDGSGGSAYREASYNAKVGGVKNSLHLYCCAFDIQDAKLDDLKWQQYCMWAKDAAYLYNVECEIGRYSWGVHVGWCRKLPYTHAGRIYEFDKR